VSDLYVVVEVDSEVGPILASYQFYNDPERQTIEIVMMRQCGQRTYPDHYTEDFLSKLDDMAWAEIRSEQ